jgi:molybdopterin molybdotransferase
MFGLMATLLPGMKTILPAKGAECKRPIPFKLIPSPDSFIIEKHMITVEEAQAVIRAARVRTHAERVRLEKALGRVLARDAVSRIFMPPFDKSAMDGYAYNSRDAADRFRVAAMIPAGIAPARPIRAGECAKIMTGGMLPRGADRVIRKELTAEEAGIMRPLGRDESPNICLKGEDVRPGDAVLKRGTRIRAQEIGILASLGAASVDVFVPPAVAVIATGTEIIAPGQALGPGRIYDSNSYSLAAQAAAAGAAVKIRRRVSDRPSLIRSAVAAALKRCDMVLISGGVSAGDLDYVPGILRELGISLKFEQIAVQPGKPTVFGTKRGRIIFGVPGNPVSTFVIFEIFIKPIMERLMGLDEEPRLIRAAMAKDLFRRKTDRAAFVPVRVRDDAVLQLDYHGSAHIHALSQADGLLYIPRGRSGYAAGSRVHVRLL